MLCYDFVALAIWSTWISVHFLPMIFLEFWNLTLMGGSWRGAVQEMINPKEPIHAAKKKSPSSMAHSGWFLVTSRWTQKVVEYGNLPKVPSIQPGKKEFLIWYNTKSRFLLLLMDLPEVSWLSEFFVASRSGQCGISGQSNSHRRRRW